MPGIVYREGECCAVPLRDVGLALGVIARTNPTGVLLGYFFGPRRLAVPGLDELPNLLAADAVLVGIFGHLGLRRGAWPIIGRLPAWERADWPMPVFVRHEELTGRTVRVFYDPNDPNTVVREDLQPPGVDGTFPTDRLMGAGFVEKTLTTILSS